MNVLILTPDAVGSTLLQRLITIYMQFHDYDRPVINLHELTNGLEKYYSPEFNREIISKRKVQNWGYYQTLEQIVDLLSSVDHYKTSRLAQYHINRRQDPLEKQIQFYQYLDDNFFVIACRRHNVFEHALSMSLNAITKKLNVYDHQEKFDTFIDIYCQGISIDQRVFESQLESYKNYLEWSTRHFNIGSYFYYDEHVENIEKYILNLPIFNNNVRKITWQEKFNIDLNDWNRCHHIPSDLGSLTTKDLTALTDHASTMLFYQKNAPEDWPAITNVRDLDSLPDKIKTQLQTMIYTSELSKFNSGTREFLTRHKSAYESARDTINKMQELDIIVSPPPIKKQTLSEKMHMIKNFDQCLMIFNQWIDKNPSIGQPLTRDDLQDQTHKEHVFWRSFKQIEAESDQRPTEMLEYQNEKNL